MAPYKYKSLSTTTSIRLVTNLTITGDYIRCDLQEVDLKNTPKYDCLSYTWGNPLYQRYLKQKICYDFDPKTAKVMHIDGDDQVLAIGKNLYDPLMEFGKAQNRKGRQDRIWIDAVCINQDDKTADPDEKKNQIMMMGRIYHQAKSVVVWLGQQMPDDPGLEITKTVLRKLAGVPHDQLGTMVLSDLDSTDTYENLGIEEVSSREWNCFGSFILRTWFARMWVVQETYFAKNFIVYCGSEILDWEDITRASRVLKETQLGKLLNEAMEQSAIEKPSATHSTYIANPISNQFIFIDIKEMGRRMYLYLERLLAYSRYFGATQSEDRVAAVLNMWKPDWKRSPEEEATVGFVMENRTSPVEVYTRATIVAIRETNDLNLLSLVEDKNWRNSGKDPNLDGLPSWVPDFSATPLWTPLSGVPRTPDGEKPWRAAGKLEFVPPVRTYSPCLGVRGCRVDEIIEFAATGLELIDDHQMFTLLEVLSRYLESPKPVGISTTDVWEPFWRTLIKNTFLGKRIEEDDSKARNAFYLIITYFVWSLDGDLQRLSRALHNPANTTKEENTNLPKFSAIKAKTKDLVDKLSAIEDSVIAKWDEMEEIINFGNDYGYVREDVEPDFENIKASFDAAYQCRRLFRTKKNYLGIAAESMKAGDEVWVLAGSAVPMVLRCEGGKWKLVGEAYVHGIMDGEAVGSEVVSIILN